MHTTTTIAPAVPHIRQGRTRALCAAGGALAAALARIVGVPLLGIHLNVRFGTRHRPRPGPRGKIWGGHAGPPPYDFRESSYADTKCSVGSYGLPAGSTANHIFMRLSALRPT